MAHPTILFIGGTGVISSESVALAARRGLEVTVLNRGSNPLRPVPEDVEVLQADVRDAAAVREALGGREFDVVADFVAFTPDQVQADIDLFEGRTAQYVFISSASAYQTPPARLPIVESTPLRNPYWPYSRNKIACEDLLVSAYRERGFPATIVRPSHTYDATNIPVNGGWTTISRMRAGRPVVVHGDGTSLWTLTHSRDFAKAFVGLLGDTRAIGDSFQITSDFVYSWDQITNILAAAAGVTADIVHVTSDAIAAADPSMGEGHLGDRTHSAIFDNGKVKALVPDYVATTPWERGAVEMIEWWDAHPDQQKIDPHIDDLFDTLIAAAR